MTTSIRLPKTAFAYESLGSGGGASRFKPSVVTFRPANSGRGKTGPREREFTNERIDLQQADLGEYVPDNGAQLVSAPPISRAAPQALLVAAVPYLLAREGMPGMRRTSGRPLLVINTAATAPTGIMARSACRSACETRAACPRVSGAWLSSQLLRPSDARVHAWNSISTIRDVTLNIHLQNNLWIIVRSDFHD
jgi:hypothetical protein